MADVAARVVAWHNRHPLARRITAEDIGQVGVVALPFAAPAPAAQDGAAPDAGDATPLRPLFGAGWMYRAQGATAARLPAWVRAHGLAAPDGFEGWPRRQIDAELPLSHRADADGLTARTLRHVLGTVVESGGQRARVLVAPRAPGGRDAVFGARQWSLPRLFTAAGLGAGALAMLAAIVAAPVSDGTGAPDTTISMAAPADVAGPDGNTRGSHGGPPAAATPAAASLLASARPSAVASAPGAPPSAPATEPGPALAEGAGRSRSAPAPHPPSGPTVTPAAGHRPVELRPRLSEAERLAARVASEQARATLATHATHATHAADAADADAASAAATAAVRPAAPADQLGPAGRAAPAAAVSPAAPRHFAVATRPLASRADAQAQEALMRGVVASQATPYPTRLELMQAQGGWRVVWWPHPDRDLAEGLLLLTRQRGLRVELVEF